MRRYLRLLTTCLILIALPFKGVAAANISLCGPVHGQAAAAAEHHDHRHSHDHGHSHDGASGTHHHGAVHGNDGTSVTKLSSLNTSNCVACTACAAHAVAGSPPVITPGFLAASPVAIPFVSSMHGGLFTDGLERPPKSLLV